MVRQKIVVSFVCLLMLSALSPVFSASNEITPSSTMKKLSQLKPPTAAVVESVLGEPQKYVWETRVALPNTYIMWYSAGVQVMIMNDMIEEIRFTRPGFEVMGIKYGTTLNKVIRIFGEPIKTMTGVKKSELASFKSNVLYRDIGGRKGYCYYRKNKRGFLFIDNKVSAFYYVIGAGSDSAKSRDMVLKSLPKPHDDVRFKDLSQLDAAQLKEIIPTLWIDQTVIWPEAVKSQVAEIIENGKNPGLGVWALHKQGITGKGVNVAIIDHPLLQDHPEYTGKFAAYKNFVDDCNKPSSVHGPAVMSLLVGNSIGTAPGAKVYYAAAPSWKDDAAYYAKALDWIVTKNAKLSVRDKIRVVSVSAAPSGEGSPFTKNKIDWDKSVERAEKAGILVLDCGTKDGIIGPCYIPQDMDREDVSKYRPGLPGMLVFLPPRQVKLLAPIYPRTTAEENDSGVCSFIYTGLGGLSWAIPYAAGVLAMGWQERPELTKEQMIDLLKASAYKDQFGNMYINPMTFIKMVQQFKA